nr:helix-turn-helix domain-containing protein [uncultured Merdimonas sp.]
MERKRKYNNRIQEVYFRIGRLLLDNRSVADLLKEGEDLLGNPIVLCDISTRMFGVSSRESVERLKDELLDSILEHGFVTADLYEKYDYEHFLPMLTTLEYSRLIRNDYEKKRDRIVGRVLFRGKYWGWIIVAEGDTPLKEEDTQIADILSQAITLILERKNAVPSNVNNEDILLELLADTYASEEEFADRVRALDFTLEGVWSVVAVCDSSGSSTASLQAYRNQLAAVLTSVSMTVYQDTLMLLINENEKKFARNALKTMIKTNHLLAAESLPFENILELSKYFRQSRELLDIALILNRKDQLVFFKDYALYHVAYLLVKEKTEAWYIPEGLTKVLEYDKDCDTEYCRSVREWSWCRNLVEAAAALGIHRNTMVYRYEKFQELSGMDLSDEECVSQLELAFHILEIKEGM